MVRSGSDHGFLSHSHTLIIFCELVIMRPSGAASTHFTLSVSGTSTLNPTDYVQEPLLEQPPTQRLLLLLLLPGGRGRSQRVIPD